MSMNVSIVGQKERAAAAEVKELHDEAGVKNTRREPVSLADRHERAIEKFSEHVPSDQRAGFRTSILARLSGHPADGAVIAAVKAVLTELGFSAVQLCQIGLPKAYDRQYKDRAALAEERSREADLE